MTPQAKSLILKAQDNIELAKRLLDDESQHEVAGYNLAQAAENYMKVLLSARDLEYPDGEEAHDLDAMMALLEEDNMTAISSHADVVELTPYNATNARIRPDERLDLREWLQYVEDLRGLVQESLGE
jgi:HEPN domain-containing protein